MRRKKVKHYNTKQIEALEAALAGQTNLYSKLLLRNTRLQHRHAALLACVLSQGDSIAGHGLCLSIVQQAVEQQDKGSEVSLLIADSLAQALAYDLHMASIMTSVCHDAAGGQLPAAELRTSRCLQAALTPGRVQQLLHGMDGSQLAAQFKALTLQLVELLVAQQQQQLGEASPQCDGGSDAKSCNSSSSNSNDHQQQAGAADTAAWEQVLLEYMGLIVLGISVQDKLLMQVAVTNFESGCLQPPPASHWEAVAAVLAQDMDAETLAQVAAAVEMDKAVRHGLGDRLATLVPRLAQLLDPPQTPQQASAGARSCSEGRSQPSRDVSAAGAAAAMPSGGSSSSLACEAGSGAAAAAAAARSAAGSCAPGGAGCTSIGRLDSATSSSSNSSAASSWWQQQQAGWTQLGVDACGLQMDALAELHQLLQQLERVLVQCRLTAHNIEFYVMNRLSLQQLALMVALAYPYLPQPLLVCQAIQQHHTSWAEGSAADTPALDDGEQDTIRAAVRLLQQHHRRQRRAQQKQQQQQQQQQQGRNQES